MKILERVRMSWLAAVAVVGLASGCAAPRGGGAQDDALRAYAARYVLPPMMVSGQAAPAVDPDYRLHLAASPGVRVDGAELTVDSGEPVAARINATLSRADDPAVAVTKTFTVTFLPRDDARYVLSYTRTPLDRETYGPPVAHSMHLALGTAPGELEPLNENYGVLFPKAVPTGRTDINEVRTLRSPHLFRLADGTFGVVATPARADGTTDPAEASSLLYFTSPDLRTFVEVGGVELGVDGVAHDPGAIYDSSTERYLVWWTDEDGTMWHVSFADLAVPETRGEVAPGGPVALAAPATTGIPGAVPSNVLPVAREVARALEVRFGRVANIAVEVEDVTLGVGERLALDTVMARLTYSDGSTARRPVDWDPEDLAAVDVATPGVYTVSGTVRQREYPFPFIPARADPSIRRYEGRYYFIATNDVDGGNVRSTSMAIRAADSIAGLPAAPEHTILTTGPAGIRGCFWAPELHSFNGTLHVLFAPCIGEASWSRVQAHVLELKRGGDPLRAEDWNAPRPVRQADGSALQLDPSHPGISLDMTYFEAAGTSYVAWSQRYIVGDTIGDAEIWIATIDPANPYRLTSEPARIITAEYGWDHNLAAVAEGAHVVVRHDTVYMTYSGSAVGPTYVMGLATAPVAADLTDPAAWSKLGYPVLKTDVGIGQWGPGHNTFTRDEDGNLLLVYHAKTTARTPERDTALRRVHWAADGLPILDMTRDEEVAPELRRVDVKVVVRDERAQ